MLELSVATKYNDRTAALFDGRVTIEGCKTAHLLLEPGEMFHRAFGYEEFDVTELSLAGHVVRVARGDSAYVGVPVFPLRMFRHSGIYIRTDRGINRPEDLRGRTIGVPEYQQTANVWIRGILQDEHGLDFKTIKWRSGGLEEPGRKERTPIYLPSDIDWTTIPETDTLNGLFEQGEIDVIISPTAPSCFAARNTDGRFALLFKDYPRHELEYFRRTKIFPIMHLIGVRKSMVEQHPWLPVSVFKAFSRAKALINLRNSTILPWAESEGLRMRELLGENYWSYEMGPNRHVLTTFARYAREQGLTDREVSPEDLFAASTLDLSRI
jgi:4,5-dihydroxyphthalate decarboxylase